MSAVAVLTGARVLAAARRKVRPKSPAELARLLIPGYRVTPTIKLISDAMKEAIEQPDGRLIISTPPRTGKSVLGSQVSVLYAMMLDQDTKAILASYNDLLAEESSREARRMIVENRDLLGFGLAMDKQSVARWRIDGQPGGMLAAGILSGITGMGATLLLIDDPVKNAQEADSPTYRRRIMNEFRSTLMTRVHPGGSVVVIQTRWHEKDLAGTLLAEEPDQWRHINIPAVSEVSVPDALNRPAGVAMTAVFGQGPEWFAKKRREVGERTWHALYQGVPSAPEGGLVKASWFSSWRLSAPPLLPVHTVVAVDPSDSGSGDSCGIVATSLTREGVVALIADVSAPLTSDAWAKAAVKLAVDVGASEIAVEGFSARETYSRVVKEALAAAKVGRPIRVSMWPPKGRARVGDAQARSAALLQALEVGTCRLAGEFTDFETKACLPADALVATPAGAKRIADIKAGDLAMTRQGPRVVTWSGQTGVRELLRVTAADGSSVELTGNHQVWTAERGWIEADRIMEGDTIATCRCLALDPPASSADVHTARVLTAITDVSRMGSITPSTAMCGQTITEGQSLPGSTFTTSTRTRKTTIRGTFRRCLMRITHGNMRIRVDSEHGIPEPAARLWRRAGSLRNRLSGFVPTVKASTYRRVNAPSTAVRDAANNTPRNAETSWREGNTTQRFVVQSSTVQSIERVGRPPEPVYDITVDDQHEFFADGVLVHNCAWQSGQHQPDSLAALVIGHDVCINAAGKTWDIAAPAGLASTGTDGGSVSSLDWMRRKIGG